MLKIKVKLYATLSSFLGDVASGTPVEMDMPAESTLGSLVELLKLPLDEVKICFVNEHIVELEQVLKEGDEVGIFPPVGGG